jgi:RimJ/RimL family protein N-acetyltransferase
MVEANFMLDAHDGIDEGDANISYGLYPAARGKGYASRAVNLMVEFLWERGVRRAVIRVAPGNERSLRVPRRTGFTEDRTIVSGDHDTLVIFVKDL